MDLSVRTRLWRRALGGVALGVCLAGGVMPAAQAQGVCDPQSQCCALGVAAGAACGGDGPTTWAAASPVDVGVGNPINLVNGNKHLQETDMAPLPGVLGLEVVRHYNSADSHVRSEPGLLGWGWRFSYEAQLTRRRDNRLDIRQADGTQWAFSRSAPVASVPGQGLLYTGSAGEVRAEAVAAGWRYRWRWTHGPHTGRELLFDAAGRLVQITAPTGEWVLIRYDPLGRLAQVTDPQGRSLFFHPVADGAAVGVAAGRFAGVGAVDSPVGRYTYHYDPATKGGWAARLVSVDWPTHQATAHAYANRPVTTSAVSRHYHHEDPRWPAHVTGISVRGTGSDGTPLESRLSTYGYNTQGRAYLSRWSGESPGSLQPLAAHEIRLTWPRPGWVWLTNGQGLQTVYRTTYQGGHVRLLEARGAGCALCTPVNRRYRYDGAGQLVGMAELATASVAADKPLPVAHVLAETRWVRDGHGRVSRVEYRRSGQARPTVQLRLGYEDPRWSGLPTHVERPSVRAGRWHRVDLAYNSHAQLAQVREEGFSPLDAAALVRTTRYRHQLLNGRSVLAEVDGPLPNGPQGTPQDSDITRFRWDGLANRVVAVERPGRLPVAVEYHQTTGLVAAAVTPDGLRTDWSYDAWQLPVDTRTQAPGWDGALWHGYRRNAMGAVTEWQEQAPGDKQVRATARAAYDDQGRLSWRAGALGMVRTFQYGPEGVLQGVRRHSATMAQDLLSPGVAEGAGAGVWKAEAASAVSAERDDWGRTVRTQSADHGWTVRTFDAVDRLVGMTDALGRVARYEWDLRGRITRQTVAGDNVADEVRTDWRYEADHLVALDHPDQRERYGYDQRGLRTSRTVWLPGWHGEGVHTRYRHDAAGRLTGVRLPGGGWLRYQRNGQGQIVAVVLNPVEAPWLQMLARETVVVSELERDLVGLRRAVAGNGIETLYQRSAQGLLARVLHRRQAVDRSVRGRHAGWGWPMAQAQAVPPTPGGGASASEPPGALGWPADPQALWDQRYLWDREGNLVHHQEKAAAPHWSTHAHDLANRWVASVSAPLVPADRGQTRFWRQAYDAGDRRVLSQSAQASQQDLVSGTQRRRYAQGTHRLLGPAGAQGYNAVGQPRAWGDATLAWDALGRLRSVDRHGRRVADYRYDHRGLRNQKATAEGTVYTVYAEDRQPLAELDPHGRLLRQYIHLAGLPLAVIDTPEGLTPASDDAGPVARVWSDLQAVLRSWVGVSAPLVWLHNNHLDAPVLATDAQRQVVWQAQYLPNGEAEVASPSWSLHLRTPGQYADTETGWVYNRQRYLDPAQGQYLSPDPLGVPDGPNPYAHVAHNPMRYVDPDGLILFSFDGTGNDLSSQTNVQWFARHYADYSAYDLAAKTQWSEYYASGPGTNPDDWTDGKLVGGLLAPVLREMVERQVTRLVTYVKNRTAWEVATAAQSGVFFSPSNPLDINLDMVGFSRGAAAAREFLNRVNDLNLKGFFRAATGGSCVRVIPRFAGLFDTVLSANVDFNMRMAIPEAVQYVAHAVAVNEHRALFPLESIETSYTNPGFVGNRVERGFVGSHSDIGGGYTVKDGSDLSDVALQWMWQQAVSQGIRMDALSPQLQVVSNPVVHDERRAILWRTLLQMQPTPDIADRRVYYPAAADALLVASLQRTAPIVGLDSQASLGFLTFRDLGLADQFNTQVADVDMVAYQAWLNQNYYGKP